MLPFMWKVGIRIGSEWRMSIMRVMRLMNLFCLTVRPWPVKPTSARSDGTLKNMLGKISILPSASASITPEKFDIYGIILSSVLR